MKFMCLVIHDHAMSANMSGQDWKKIQEESMAYDVSLFARNVFIAAEALEDGETARTVRVRNGEALVTDGPFMETKEQVAGFILIDARDADHALEIAKGIPMARIGAVEVRPVMTFEGS